MTLVLVWTQKKPNLKTTANAATVMVTVGMVCGGGGKRKETERPYVGRGGQAERSGAGNAYSI